MDVGYSQGSMGPAFEVVTSLSTAATACLLPDGSSAALTAHSVPSSCFDSLAGGAGSAPWVAVRTTPYAVQILHGAVPHVALLLPEPVAAVQLGAAQVTTAAAGAAAAPEQQGKGCADGDKSAATVIVVVGESCRVWAWRLHQTAAAGSSAAVRGQRHHGDTFSAAAEEDGSGGSSRRGKRKLGLSSSTSEVAGVQPGLGGAGTAAGSTKQAIRLAPDGDSNSWGMPPWLAAATSPPGLEVQSAPLQMPHANHTSSVGSSSSGSAACMAAVAELAAAPKLGSVESAAARAQLAAQVAWEYMDAVLLQEGFEGLGRCEGPAGGPHSSALAKPISLSKAGGVQAGGTSTAAGAVPAAVVHSVATWAASHDLPADACCACFLALSLAPPASCPEFRSSTRLGWGATEAQQQQQQQCAAGEGRSSRVAAGEGEGPSDAMEWEAAPTSPMAAPGQGTPGRPLGYLLVGTASGEVSAFPVGTPLGSSLRGTGSKHGKPGAGSGSGTAATVGWLESQRPVAVICGTRLQLVWLPGGQQAVSGGPSAAAAGTENGGTLRLVLHAASGTVAPSPPDPCRAVALAGGSVTEREAAAVVGSGGNNEAQLGGMLAAVMRVSGDVDSLVVQGRILYYTARGKLRCLDCTSLQQLLGSGSPANVGGSPQAIHIPTPVPIHLLSTPAAAEQQPSGHGSTASEQELLLLSASGLLLCMACPAGTSWLHTAASRREAVPLAELEQEMQELVGDVAELSASQEAATAALAQLDSQLRALSSAIPAVQSINCGTTAGLYCSVRPLYRLAAVVGGGEEGGFAVEVSLHNGGLWELPVGHSLVVLLSGPPLSANDPDWPVNSRSGEREEEEDQHCISHSVPLPRLPPGSSHTCTCFLAAPTTSGSGRWQAGVLRVLLCHHGAAGEAHAALLHTLRLDPLHFHQPGPSLAHPAPAPATGSMGFSTLEDGSLGRAAQHHHMQLPASGQAAAVAAAEVRLRLQLPCWLFGRRPDAGAALAALLDQGLSSLDPSPTPAAPGRNTGIAGSSYNWGWAGAGAGAGASAGGGQGSAVGPAALEGGTGSWGKAAQQARAARQARQQQLFGTQLCPSAAQALPLAAGSAGLAGSAGSQVPGGLPGPEGTAWWEPWLLQQRQQHMLPPSAAFSLLPPVPGGVMASGPSGHSMLSSTTGGAAGQAAGAHPVHPAVVHADFATNQAGGGTTSVQISARMVPRRGPQAGASWQHAELEVTTRSAGVSATLGAHAALVQRVMAVLSSMPEQDLPFGLRLSASGSGGAGAQASASSLGALLVHQDAMSALEAAVEGADEAELEGALCTLRQLKARALALRDEALGLAQQAEQAQQAQLAEEDRGEAPAGQAVGRAGGMPQEPNVGRHSSSRPAGATAEEQQARGVQLQRDLQELALSLRQQAGSVPVILT